TIQLICKGAFLQDAGVSAQSQCASDVFYADLILHDVDDRVGCIGFELHAVGVVVADDIPGKFHDCELHSEAEAEERDVVGAGIFDSLDLALHAAMAEASGDKDAADITKDLIYVFRCDSL